MTGFCDSLNTPECNGSAGEVKCCQVDGYLVDGNTCIDEGLEAGLVRGCQKIAESYEYPLATTCVSLADNRCNDAAGLANSSATNVRGSDHNTTTHYVSLFLFPVFKSECCKATLNSKMVLRYPGNKSYDSFCPWYFGSGRLECPLDGQVLFGRCGSLGAKVCEAETHGIKCCIAISVSV